MADTHTSESPDLSDPTPFPLLALPPELRALIIQQLYTPIVFLLEQDTHSPCTLRILSPQTPSERIYTLSQVSRCLRHEVRAAVSADLLIRVVHGQKPPSATECLELVARCTEKSYKPWRRQQRRDRAFLGSIKRWRIVLEEWHGPNPALVDTGNEAKDGGSAKRNLGLVEVLVASLKHVVKDQEIRVETLTIRPWATPKRGPGCLSLLIRTARDLRDLGLQMPKQVCVQQRIMSPRMYTWDELCGLEDVEAAQEEFSTWSRHATFTR